MSYQISCNGEERSSVLQAIIILKNNPYNVVYNKNFIDFIFDLAQNCSIEELSIELITANNYDMLQRKEKYLNQVIDYMVEIDSGYNQIWSECTRKIKASESVVLAYYMNDNEDDSCDLSSLLNAIRAEERFVKVIIADDDIIPAIPEWFVESFAAKGGIKELSYGNTKASLIRKLCKKISIIKERVLCEWYGLLNKKTFFMLVLLCRDKTGTIFPKYEPVSINLGKVREEIIKDLKPCALDVYNRVEGGKQDIISNMMEAQSELNKLRRRMCGLSEQIHIEVAPKNVISIDEASRRCNLSTRGWRDAFDIMVPSQKRTLYAVAVGMKMSYEDLKWLLWCKGYVIKPMHNLTDAVVEMFIKYYRYKDITIDDVNQILLAFNQKTLGEDLSQ